MRISIDSKLRRLRAFAILALALPLFAVSATGTSFAQPTCRTFTETGKTVCDKFLTYWDANGGLAQQGFPIADQMSEQSTTDGKIYTVQYFERAVFELHPEFAGTDNEVLLALLGVFTYQDKYANGAPNQVPNAEADARLFPETGKRVGGAFLRYWNEHGGLRQQGLPISDEFIEINELDMKPYKVQYFERAVFEFHPEFAGTPNEVLLSQLGTFRYRELYQRPTPTATVVPPAATATRPATTATMTIALPSATSTSQPAGDPCVNIPASVNMTVQPNCGTAEVTTFTFRGMNFQPGETVGVYATSPDGAVYGSDFQLEAAGDGTTDEVFLGPLPGDDLYLGIWAVTMEGISSGTKGIGYIRLVSSTAGSGGGPCDPSGSINGSANPSSGTVGDIIEITATGFSPTENVSYWFTLPDGSVFGSTEPTPGFVNPDGSIGPLPIEIDELFVELGPGKWGITFVGEDTENMAIIYFCVVEQP